VNALEDALYTQLAGGTELTAALNNGTASLFTPIAAQGAALPLVRFFMSSGLDDNDSPRRAKTYMYSVIAEADDAKEAGDIDALVDTRLHNATLTVTGWNDYWCRRESDVNYEEKTQGAGLIFHRGAQYRIRMAE